MNLSDERVREILSAPKDCQLTEMVILAREVINLRTANGLLTEVNERIERELDMWKLNAQAMAESEQNVRRELDEYRGIVR